MRLETRKASQTFALGPSGQVRPFAAENPIVRFAGVTRAYGSRVALDDVHLELQPGELAFLVGPSGAGKTTILKLINREIRPTQGEVTVAGIAAHLLKGSRVAELRRRVGVVFQDYKLLPRLTAGRRPPHFGRGGARPVTRRSRSRWSWGPRQRAAASALGRAAAAGRDRPRGCGQAPAADR